VIAWGRRCIRHGYELCWGRPSKGSLIWSTESTTGGRRWTHGDWSHISTRNGTTSSLHSSSPMNDTYKTSHCTPPLRCRQSWATRGSSLNAPHSKIQWSCSNTCLYTTRKQSPYGKRIDKWMNRSKQATVQNDSTCREHWCSGAKTTFRTTMNYVDYKVLAVVACMFIYPCPVL
jgi:hypothetical protein